MTWTCFPPIKCDMLMKLHFYYFRQTKKCISTLNKNRQFVYQAMSIVSNIIYAITDIHCCFSSNIISCCATCFAQIEMFVIECCNSTVSLGYPPSYNETFIYLSTLENNLQNRPSWKCRFSYCLALTRIESKASLYSMGCTACKQAYCMVAVIFCTEISHVNYSVSNQHWTSSSKLLQWIQCAEQIYIQMLKLSCF